MLLLLLLRGDGLALGGDQGGVLEVDFELSVRQRDVDGHLGVVGRAVGALRALLLVGKHLHDLDELVDEVSADVLPARGLNVAHRAGVEGHRLVRVAAGRPVVLEPANVTELVRFFVDGARVEDPGVEDICEGGAVDDGDAEEEADVAPDLGVQVGQCVVPDDASQLDLSYTYTG